MIENDFKIDFKNKKIFYNPKGSEEVYIVNALYTYLQDFFSREQNMKYQIPIIAMSKTEYFLINGWKIDKKAKKYLREGTLVESN